MSRTQSDYSERRNKEIGSSQALGSSVQSNRNDWHTEIGSVWPKIAATGMRVGFVAIIKVLTRRDIVRQATYLVCMHTRYFESFVLLKRKKRQSAQ